MRRPSPAMVVAVVALLLACAGSATAAAVLTGADVRDESLTGKDVKNRSLTGRDVKANSLTGGTVKGLSGRDVIKDGLDGSDIDEETLDTVPTATRAKTADKATRAETADAVNGARIVRLRSSQVAGASTTVLYDEGGLRLEVECTASGKLAARAIPTTTGGIIRVAVSRPAAPTETTIVADNEFQGADVANLTAGGTANNVSGTLTYTTPGGEVTTAQYLTHEEDACVMAGSAVHTAP